MDVMPNLKPKRMPVIPTASKWSAVGDLTLGHRSECTSSRLVSDDSGGKTTTTST